MAQPSTLTTIVALSILLLQSSSTKDCSQLQTCITCIASSRCIYIQNLDLQFACIPRQIKYVDAKRIFRSKPRCLLLSTSDTVISHISLNTSTPTAISAQEISKLVPESSTLVSISSPSTNFPQETSTVIIVTASKNQPPPSVPPTSISTTTPMSSPKLFLLPEVSTLVSIDTMPTNSPNETSTFRTAPVVLKTAKVEIPELISKSTTSGSSQESTLKLMPIKIPSDVPLLAVSNSSFNSIGTSDILSLKTPNINLNTAPSNTLLKPQSIGSEVLSTNSTSSLELSITLTNTGISPTTLTSQTPSMDAESAKNVQLTFRPQSEFPSSSSKMLPNASSTLTSHENPPASATSLQITTPIPLTVLHQNVAPKLPYLDPVLQSYQSSENSNGKTSHSTPVDSPSNAYENTKLLLAIEPSPLPTISDAVTSHPPKSRASIRKLFGIATNDSKFTNKRLERKIKYHACLIAYFQQLYLYQNQMGDKWFRFSITNPMLNQYSECKKLLRKKIINF